MAIDQNDVEALYNSGLAPALYALLIADNWTVKDSYGFLVTYAFIVCFHTGISHQMHRLAAKEGGVMTDEVLRGSTIFIFGFVPDILFATFKCVLYAHWCFRMSRGEVASLQLIVSRPKFEQRMIAMTGLFLFLF